MIYDPVCGKRVNSNKAHIKIKYKRMTYYLCCSFCQKEFESNPEKYSRETNSKNKPRASKV